MFAVQYRWNCITYLQLCGDESSSRCMEFSLLSTLFCWVWRHVWLLHWLTSSCLERTIVGGGVPSSVLGEYGGLCVPCMPGNCRIVPIHFLAGCRKKALVLLGLCSHMNVFINCCLRFLCCHHLAVVTVGFASSSQVIAWQSRLCNVSSGTLNCSTPTNT